MNMQERTTLALTRLLVTGDEADRCYAARTLGVIGNEASLDALIECLTDEDIDVCVDAAEALGKLGDQRAIPALIESLNNDASGEVCTSVATALGELGGDEAIEALKEIAAKRPDRLEWEDDWDTWWDVQLAAVQALGRYRVEEATDILLEIMDSDESQDIDAEIFTALSQINGAGTAALLQRLVSGNALHRRRAVSALGKSDNPEFTQAIGRALRDQAPEVRAAAAQALAARGAENYLSALLLLLRDESNEVRNAAIDACQTLSQKSTAPADIIREITPLLSDPSPMVRTTTCNTLAGIIGQKMLDDAVLQTLEANLKEQDFNTAAAACDLLGTNAEPASTEALTAAAKDDSLYPMVRRHAILALGKIGINNRQIIDALKQIVFDKEQPVRLAALDTLIQLSGVPPQPAPPEETETAPPTALDIVIAAVRGELENTTAATHASATISQAVEFDTDTITSSSPGSPAADESADTAEPLALPEEPGRVVASGEINKAVSTLEAIALDNAEVALGVHKPSDPVEEVDEETANYLKMVEDNNRVTKRARQNREMTLEDDVRRLGVRTLIGQTDETAIEALIDALNDKDPELRREAALAIAETAKDNPDLPGLMNAMGSLMTQLAMGNDAQRQASARALGRLRNRSAILPLLDALKNGSTQLRLEAIAALVELALNGADPEAADHMVTSQASAKTILRIINPYLQYEESGVRLAAAKGIAQLLELDELESFRDASVKEFIATAYQGAGAQARHIGKLLRDIDASTSASLLLNDLDTVETSSERRFVIEMLEELFISPADSSLVS